MKRRNRQRNNEPQAKPSASPRKNGLPSKAISFFTQGWGAYTIPLVLIILYYPLELAPYSAVLGLLCFLSMAYIIVMDMRPTKAETRNVAKPLWELAKTLAIALSAWVIVCIILQTGKPMNVVTSCSMLPVLHRGDLVFLQGGQINAPTAQISASLKAADISYVNCTVNFLNGSKATTPCVSSVRVGSSDYPARTQNDVIIYDAEPVAYGAIIHRSVLWLAAGNQSFLLTKGDNNPGLDQQSGISPVTADRINGKVILTVPAIGYLKVFLFAGFDFILRLPTGDLAYAMSAFDAPAGCNYVLSRN
ncbi:MAG: hypothetical protein WCX64_01635 [Candidatus Micrarchaeia archaeon]